MKLNRIHAIIGLLLVLIPFTGFSRGFKYGFMIFAGIVILYFAVNSIHLEIRKKQSRKHHRNDTFVESKPKFNPEQEAKSETISEESSIQDSSENNATSSADGEILG